MQAPAPENTPPRRRLLTRGRFVLYGGLLLVCSLCFAYVKLTDSLRVAEIARDTLARMTGADVQISGAAFELNGTIRLFDVELRIPEVPGAPTGGDRLFTADQILIEHNMWALAKGGLEVQSVSLIRPTFFPTEDADNGKFTFQYLKPKSKPKKKDKSRSIDLPDVHLSQALVVFGEIADGEYRALQTTQLSGYLTRQPKETGIYSFALRQLRGERQFVLSGDFDLYQETMTARMQLGRLTPGDQRIDMLPRQIRTLFQKLQPIGNFPVITFGYDKERQFNAIVEITDGGVNVPWGESEMRIENTRGSVAIEYNNRLVVDLKGEANGINYGAVYEIKGSVDGFEDDAAFDVQAKVRGAMPDTPQDLELMPGPVRNAIERVQPRGKFDVDVSLMRDGASGVILTHGTVRIIDGAIVYNMFPYPLHALNGVIRFDNERIDFRDITGLGPMNELGQQAKVNISGHVIGGGRWPGVHVSVTSREGPVDKWLYEALNEKERPIYDMFFDKVQHARFLDEETGQLQTSDQRAARLKEIDELTLARPSLLVAAPLDEAALAALDAKLARLKALAQRPVFDLGGLSTAQVDVRTFPGERRTYTTIRASSQGMRIAYEHWPYPLIVEEGELQINVPAVNGEVVRVQGGAKGLTGGRIDIAGIMKPPLERGKPLIPDLTLTAKLPIDELLLLSLPPADAQVVRQLNIEGDITASGRIENDIDQRLDFRIGIAMADGKARPNNGSYDLTDVAARLMIHRRGVDLQSVTARHKQSTLKVSREPASTGDGTTLVLEGTRVAFTDPITDLIPEGEPAVKQVRALLDQYKPTGEFDFKLDNLERVEGGTGYRFLLSPRKLSFDLNGERIDTDDLKGSALVTPKRITFNQLRGDFGTGRFRLDGGIETRSPAAYDLSFDIEAGSYCKVTQALLPRGALGAIQSLKLEGGYRIQDAKLTIDPAAVDKAQLRFDAVVRLDDGKATIGVPITRLTGDLNIAVTEQKLGDLPLIDLRLDRVRLRAADRWVDPLGVRIISGDKPGVFHIQKLRGNIYGGSLTGSGMLYRQGTTDRYKMEIALQEVSLDPFVNPTDPKHEPVIPVARPGQDSVRLIGDLPRDGDSEPRDRQRPERVVRERSGLLSASLAIEGDSGDDQTKRGRGDLRVRDAAIYETQLGLSLLQLLNLSAPVSRSFDKVEASYLIDGDLVRLDRIQFIAPTLTITGKGTMKYSTLALDLSMTSANPRGLELGPLTDVIKLLKDELVSIKVTGTLTQPQASVQSLKGISGAVDEVLGKPREPRRAPLPPLREPDGK